MEASLARSTATMTATPRATAATVSSARTGAATMGRTISRNSTTAHAMEVSTDVYSSGGRESPRTSVPLLRTSRRSHSAAAARL